MAILLIDDSPDDCLLIGVHLKSAGYAVVTMNSAKEALNYLHQSAVGESSVTIDLILLDIKMPGIDGLDACARIKSLKEFETVPILMISADTTSGTIQLAFRRGAVDYIRKPTIKVELLAKVAMVLRIHEEAKQRAQLQKMVPQEMNIQLPRTADVVTDIMDWSSFDELFEREWGRAIRDKRPISLLCLGIDNFKSFNETYGYATGAECLERIGQAAQEMFNQPDQAVARSQGPEFVVLLVGTGAEEVQPMTDRLDDAIVALDLGPIVTIGAATAYPEEGTDCADLITAAKNAVPNRK